MDSTAYKYLLEKLNADFPSLHFAMSAVITPNESFASLVSFLKAKTAEGIPGLLWRRGAFFADLFRSAHGALADVLSGHDASSHAFRTNGMQLTRFLTFCAGNARDEKPLFVKEPDPADCAMLCFLTEGMMHAGWCPNAFEGEAKRAAHSYFIGLRKSLHRVRQTHMPVILGYLWSAWLLARKTEGIRTEGCESPLIGSETFSWKLQTEARTFLARKALSAGLFYLVSKSPFSLPHPFAFLMSEGSVGLTLRVNGQAVTAVSLADFGEIRRQKISGDRFIHNCKTPSIPDIEWTVAILTVESTVYRLDILKFREGTGSAENLAIDVAMKLECGPHPESLGSNMFICKGPQNTVVRFLDSAFTFAFDRMEDADISVFKASGCHGKGALRFVTAWATGKGISAINETKLLGIYD